MEPKVILAISLLTILAPSLVPLAATQNGGTSSQSNLGALAARYIDHLASSDYASAAEDLPSKEKLSPAEVEQWWKGQSAHLGSFIAREGVATQKFATFEVAYIRCKFAKGELEFQLAFYPTSQAYTPAFVALVPPRHSVLKVAMIAKAKTYVRLLLIGNLAEAIKLWVASDVPKPLQVERGYILSQLGRMRKEIGATAGEEYLRATNMVAVRWEFERGQCTFLVTFDDSLKIVNVTTDIAPVFPPYKQPVYVQPQAFLERPVVIGSGPWSLPGILTIPVSSATLKPPFPTVILIQGGPGPSDMDVSVGPYKMFRDLAGGLASRGIAVLRYDKRPFAHFVRFYAQPNYSLREETVEDALAAVSVLYSFREVDRRNVFLVGHSMGGMLAPRIGKLERRLAGLIIMAGPSRPFEDISLSQRFFQFFYLNGLGLSADEKLQLEELKKQVEKVKSNKVTPASLPAELPDNLPANFWLDLRHYAPPIVARGLKKPMLIMQGEDDYYLLPEDFMGWKRALSGRADVEFKTYEGLDHMFMNTIEGVNDGNITNSVAHVVIDDVSTWIKKSATRYSKKESR